MDNSDDVADEQPKKEPLALTFTGQQIFHQAFMHELNTSIEKQDEPEASDEA